MNDLNSQDAYLLVSEDPPSPCTKLCKISSESGYCLGCLRTIDEITVWSRANRQTKVQIWENIRLRKLVD
jgi:hypothetical protein